MPTRRNVRRGGGEHGPGEYVPSRKDDWSFWAAAHDLLDKYHLLITILAIVGGFLGFTIVTPAQTATRTREALEQKLDSNAIKTDRRITPIERNQAEVIDNVRTIVRYLCVRDQGPNAATLRQAAGLTPEKCNK